MHKIDNEKNDLYIIKNRMELKLEELSKFYTEKTKELEKEKELIKEEIKRKEDKLEGAY